MQQAYKHALGAENTKCSHILVYNSSETLDTKLACLIHDVISQSLPIFVHASIRFKLHVARVLAHLFP